MHLAATNFFSFSLPACHKHHQLLLYNDSWGTYNFFLFRLVWSLLNHTVMMEQGSVVDDCQPLQMDDGIVNRITSGCAAVLAAQLNSTQPKQPLACFKCGAVFCLNTRQRRQRNLTGLNCMFEPDETQRTRTKNTTKQLQNI